MYSSEFEYVTIDSAIGLRGLTFSNQENKLIEIFIKVATIQTTEEIAHL